jgi:hypothetical protein
VVDEDLGRRPANQDRQNAQFALAQDCGAFTIGSESAGMEISEEDPRRERARLNGSTISGNPVSSRHAPYTGRGAWVAVCVLPARSQRVGITFRGRVSRIEAPSVTRQGNWEVSVSFDPVLCEISCVYRLRTDRLGRPPAADLLLPPVIDIRLFSDGAAVPWTVTVDLARTREPGIVSWARAELDPSALPTARVPQRPVSSQIAVSSTSAPRPPRHRSAVRLVPLPLRV